ncbi:MAG: PTS sugar transporter subunit IIC [Oscillospiraceae bacterium]|nr:PTS sugar transporter subunit IIC [Oscillospiraceae bacterium]
MTIRTYFANVLDGMAKGLFASLIVGVIVRQIGMITNISVITTIGQIAQYLMGPCIGAGIAYARNCKQFTVLASMVNGALGAGAIKLAVDAATGALSPSVSVGEPVGAFVAVIVGLEIGRLVEGRTKFDLLIIPAVVIMSGGCIGVFISPYIAFALNQVGAAINSFTQLQPLPMGILLGIAVGMILTLPISSAALCISINIGGIAAGAALAGCCAQMVGFAVMSIRENKLGGLLSQGVGTSMLQVPNIVKNPLIWIPPTVASGICGALSTMLFHMETTRVGAGMGTSGLVGQFETISVMGSDILPAILILHVAIPAVISLAGGEFMRKMNWIKPGDLQL